MPTETIIRLLHGSPTAMALDQIVNLTRRPLANVRLDMDRLVAAGTVVDRLPALEAEYGPSSRGAMIWARFYLA